MSGSLPKCVGKVCKDEIPDELQNKLEEPEYTNDQRYQPNPPTKATYQCKSGYQLADELYGERQCVADEYGALSWFPNNVLPTTACVPQQCAPLDAIDNATWAFVEGEGAYPSKVRRSRLCGWVPVCLLLLCWRLVLFSFVRCAC